MTSSAAKAPMLADLGAEPVVADALDARPHPRRPRRATRRRGQHDDPDPRQPGRPSHMRATNELRERGVRNLLDAAVAAGARRFVSESFFGVYGFGPHERPAHRGRPHRSRAQPGRPGRRRRDRVIREPGPRRQRRAADRGGVAALRRLPGPPRAQHGHDGRARAQAPAPSRRRPGRDDADGRARRRRPAPWPTRWSARPPGGSTTSPTTRPWRWSTT